MRSFEDLDDRLLLAPPLPGVVIVRAPPELHGPLLAHVARRLRTMGCAPITGQTRRGAPIVREIANQLGLAQIPSDPLACAELLSEAAAAGSQAGARAIVVSLVDRADRADPHLSPPDTWDRAILQELARTTRSVLVLICSGEPPASTGVDAVFEVCGEIGASEKLRWLSAVAEEAQSTLPSNDLRTLEAWWTKAHRVSAAGTIDLAAVGPVARSILRCLALAGRSLPLSTLAVLGDDALAAIDELVAIGAASRSGLYVTSTPACDVRALEADADDAIRLATARMLAGGAGFDPDLWAFARAAELLVGAGAYDAADAAMAKAMRGLHDPRIAHELTQRWFAAVRPIKGERGLELRMRAATRALDVGEATDARRWCESATALGSNVAAEPAIALLMGRALMQLGDLVAARVSLHKATSDDRELQARVAAALAETHYLGGDLESARSHGHAAVVGALTLETRLDGRNTIGKILLAKAEWDAADEHFADDTLTAAAGGAATSELRARLNRAIALLSKGLLDDARALLERVLVDGTRIGSDRSRAHALGNLAVIAHRRHEYAEALSLWEQTIGFPQALRGRIASARTIANLAELRLRLGLLDHAEQAIGFGRRVLGTGTTAARASHFSRVAARVALVRGNTELARREIEAAIHDSEKAGEKDFLCEAYRVAARVALEDGDLSRATDMIAKAESITTNDRGQAEVAIVRALRLRALGQNALEAATEALALARTSGEEDLVGEIHLLLATIHRDLGDIASAQAACARAVAVRDSVAAALPSDIRAAFLAKADMVALSRLHSLLASSQEGDVEEEAPRSQRPPRVDFTKPREIVGEDPQIRALVNAIRKVAKASSTVLVRGESGTGKELVAEALHRASDRATGPLVSVNCAALVETLLLSELFGHEKGAFTGASARRRGRFELAEGGTLFLDEIGDISARTQVALLRVLQEKTFERVGGTHAIRANVRVICATHRDLKAMVERGDFREDLYYRLRGIILEVPALRARLSDLPKLAEHLLERIASERGEAAKTLTLDALELLQRHRWPGNIRELENVLRAASLFAEGESIGAPDFIENVEDLRALAQAGPASVAPMSLRAVSLVPPVHASTDAPDASSSVLLLHEEEEGGCLPDGESSATAVAYAQVRGGAVSLADMKRQIERDCIARALAETKGNITRAAALLGMKRPRLSQLVKQYGLSASSEACL